MRVAALIRSCLLVASAIPVCGAGHASAQSADNPAMYRGPDREQRLIEGARNEGQVTVYSSMIADQALRPILNGFEAKYPFVKPQYVRDDPPQQLQKVMAESRAGRMVADVLESTGLEVPVRAANINQPFWSPRDRGLPAGTPRPAELLGTDAVQLSRRLLQHQSGQTRRCAEELRGFPRSEVEGQDRLVQHGDRRHAVHHRRRATSWARRRLSPICSSWRSRTSRRSHPPIVSSSTA